MARSTEMDTPGSGRDKITSATSSASLYDNINNANTVLGKEKRESFRQKDKQQNEICQATPKTVNVAIGTANTVTVGSQVRQTFFPCNQVFVDFYFYIPSMSGVECMRKFSQI